VVQNTDGKSTAKLGEEEGRQAATDTGEDHRKQVVLPDTVNLLWNDKMKLQEG
jgi:hypothetical protein